MSRDCEHVVTEHLRYMTNNNISVEPMLRHLPSFYWLPKLHKQPYGTKFIAASNKCSTKPLLLHVYLKSPVTFKSIVLALTQEQG